MTNFNFDVFVPIDTIKKSSDISKTKNGNYIVAGYASTGNIDLDGETIEPEGIDYDYLMGPNGFIDYEHDVDNVIGFPTDNTHVDENGLFLEAELFGDDDDVKKMIKLYKNLKSSSANKSLGFSVEGIVGERESYDDNVIKQVSITGVAVTKHPANMEATWELLHKSIISPNDKSKRELIAKSGPMEAGVGISPETQTDGAALRPEAFADHIKEVTYSLNKYKELGMLPEFLGKVASIMDNSNSNLEEKSAFLQVATGESKKDVLESLGNFKANLGSMKHAMDGGDASQQADDDDDDD